MSFFALCTESVGLYHLCVANDIEFCPQSADTNLTMDTFSTYLAVAATFGPFIPEQYADIYMGCMVLFSSVLMQILYDSFWSIFFIVPVASIPFWLDGQANDVIWHPLDNWLHYVSIVIGLGAVYCKYKAGTDPTTADYQTYHPLWHTLVCLSSDAFIANQVRDTHESTIQYTALNNPVRALQQRFSRSPPAAAAEKTTTTPV
jgi:hypothetical protein